MSLRCLSSRRCRCLCSKDQPWPLDAYGDLRLRECGDLDMLIRPEDFPRVRELLCDNGFELFVGSSGWRKEAAAVCL